MMDLTTDQRDMLLYLGGPDDSGKTLQLKTLKELEGLGLVYQREDGPWDFTKAGEELYERLFGRAAG
jgi:hypothetical protein